MTGAIDISRSISAGTLVYPGDLPPRMARALDIARGDPFNLLELHWTGHLATHVDAPLHFVSGGAGISDVPLDRFMGDALVIAVDGPAVLPEHVPELAADLHLLFKTRNSDHWDPVVYNADHVYVSAAAAETIATRGARLVGIDYLNVDNSRDETFPAHRILLGAGVCILEGIDLSGVEPGPYTLLALPLKIEGGDGSPVRAVLLPRE